MIASPAPARAAGLVCAVALACGATLGCGARSALVDEERPGTGGGGAGGEAGGGGTTTSSTSSTSTSTTTTVTGCTSDAECNDGIDCTLDGCIAGLCQHVLDSGACDDGVVCTLDTCSAVSGCNHQPSDAACDDGIGCTIDICDLAADACEHAPCDSGCDDSTFCNGVERCDAALGCVPGPPACTLGLGCEMSMCSEATDFCTHSFPAGCAPPDVHLLVTDPSGTLWDVTPYQDAGSVMLAAGVATHLDIAILDGRWFAIDPEVVELKPGTNEVIQLLGNVAANSLAGGPDGKLYAASHEVYRIDPDSGAVEIVGSLPPGHSSSGDIAFLGDRMFVSTNSGCGGALVEFDLSTGTGTVLGGDGLGCVYGLAGGSELFILNCDGKVGAFDPDTGQARIFATTSVQVYGADRLP